MDWINLLLIEHSSLQAIVIVSLICAIGMALGKVKIAGISLGVTFVFFIGIIAGHIGWVPDSSARSPTAESS